MSLSSENSSLSGGSLRGKDHRSPSAIAAFNKRRLHGDYGVQPNAPSVGVKTAGEDANTSALKAVGSKLGPKLWYPTETPMAARASSLATSSSASFIPDAHFVPKSTNEASRAATSAIAVPGEEYGARHQPEAYKWGKQPSQWQHLGANSSVAASQRAQSRSAAQQSGGTHTLNLQPAPQAIDISKVLATAERNARNRLASADNHLPENFGIPTAEQQAQRRQQVLSLITIADKRVKDQMAQLDRDATAGQVFNSVEFQKIAMEISARRNAPRMENIGKRDLGGGLYMTQDEIDDIARRHVQPVLDKVTLVADKKRITDREQAQREAQIREAAQAEKERERQRKALEKQQAAEDKLRRKQHEADAKQKAERAAQRSKEQHPEGSHLWHWQQVEIIKDDVKESKNLREEKQERYNRVRKQHDQAKEDLAALIERHHELKRDYFQRGEQIEQKSSQYDDDAETASLFSLKQRRETVKTSTLTAKNKRTELEANVQRLESEEEAAKREADEAADRHHELKKKYFEAREVAEEEEKKFQAEEEARLKREAEERAQREAEAAERAQREAEERAERSRVEAEERAQREAAGASAPAAASAAPAKASGKADKSKPKKGKEEPAPAPASKPVDEVPADFKMPPKSKLISLGDARSGPILSGYKAPAPSKSDTKDKAAEAKTEAENKTEAATPKADATEAEAKADATEAKDAGSESHGEAALGSKADATESADKAAGAGVGAGAGAGAGAVTSAATGATTGEEAIVFRENTAAKGTADHTLAAPVADAAPSTESKAAEHPKESAAAPISGAGAAGGPALPVTTKDEAPEHISSAPTEQKDTVRAVPVIGEATTGSIPTSSATEHIAAAPVTDVDLTPAGAESKKSGFDAPANGAAATGSTAGASIPKADKEEPSNTIVEKTNIKATSEEPEMAKSAVPVTPVSSGAENSRSSSEEPGASASKLDKKADKKARKKAEKAERLAEFAEKKAESNRKAEAIRKAEEEKSRNITSDEAEAIFDKAFKEVKSEPSNTTSAVDQFQGFDSSNVKEQVKETGVFKEEI